MTVVSTAATARQIAKMRENLNRRCLGFGRWAEPSKTSAEFEPFSDGSVAGITFSMFSSNQLIAKTNAVARRNERAMPIRLGCNQNRIHPSYYFLPARLVLLANSMTNHIQRNQQ